MSFSARRTLGCASPATLTDGISNIPPSPLPWVSATPSLPLSFDALDALETAESDRSIAAEVFVMRSARYLVSCSYTSIQTYSSLL